MDKNRRKPINEILAHNIAEAMVMRQVRTQAQLAKLSGVAQRTISNYLSPKNRVKGSSGKQPSAKLSEVEQIAKALDVETWDLLRELRPGEREFYDQIKAAYNKLHPPPSQD